jgi:hypothetical protein
MQFNNQKPAGTQGSSPISALYPPTKLDGDKSTILGNLEGIGVESFVYDEERGYAKLTVFKEIEGTENKRSYNTIINDFTTSQARYDLNMMFLQDGFLSVQPDADLTPLLADLETFKDVVEAFNTVFTFPSKMSEDAVAKIVFQKESGDKAQYSLSKIFPSFGLKSNAGIKFKKVGEQWGDIIEFTKGNVVNQTDGMLGSSDFSIPVVDQKLPF